MFKQIPQRSFLAMAIALSTGVIVAGELPTLNGAAPIVIGHRGAAGYRPEHTLSGYTLAIEMGADYIEPDLVLTQDGQMIALAKKRSRETGRTIGIYPEIKHSTFHAGLFGKNVFENKLLKTLHAQYGNSKCAPVYIQSFEVSNLRYLSKKTRIKLVQLLDAEDVNADGSLALTPPYRQPYDFVVSGDPRTFGDLLTDKGLDFVRRYADAIGPWKPYLVKTVDDRQDRNGDGKLTINDRRVVGGTGVIEKAHQRGLLVHTWTFRNDSSGYGFSDPQAEIKYYFELGVDGLFTDFADTGVAARAELVTVGPQTRLTGQCAHRHEHDHGRGGREHRRD